HRRSARGRRLAEGGKFSRDRGGSSNLRLAQSEFLNMLLLATVNWLHYMFMVPLTLLSVFLMLVILVQRGRGGGLTGALGGMGGQSAFGTKAGDLFTKITIGVAIVWVVSTMLIIKYVGSQSQTGGLSSTKSSTPTSKIKTDD